MLIFQNGMIYFDKSAAGGDIDNNGLPIEGGEMSYSAPCFIEVSNEDKGGRTEDNAYENGTYSVMIDYDSVDDDFNPTKCLLVHERKGKLGGPKTIQCIEFYNLTRTIQLWV